MSYRGGGAQQTGSNTVPVAPRKRRSNLPDDSQNAQTNGTSAGKDVEREGRPRKKRSRWGNSDAKVNIPGLATSIPSGLNKEQQDAYLLTLRLEEISAKLRSGDVVPETRSPSPPPEYGPGGIRVNTRENRYRTKLEAERHRLVEKGLATIPNFRAPSDYKKPTKITEKVFIPSKDYPEINFIGQLIGPRGNTLKKMESETGTKISIRGQGSVKEGKSRADGSAQPGEEEQLHCLVMADSEEKVKAGVIMVNKILETAITIPEGQNELKRLQLRELASLNGTLRDDENVVCTNCGNSGHRKYDCTEVNATNMTVCKICGNAGHTARDCMERNNPQSLQQAKERDAKLDDEYLSLMKELGEGSVPTQLVKKTTSGPGGMASASPIVTSGGPGWSGTDETNRPASAGSGVGHYGPPTAGPVSQPPASYSHSSPYGAPAPQAGGYGAGYPPARPPNSYASYGNYGPASGRSGEVHSGYSNGPSGYYSRPPSHHMQYTAPPPPPSDMAAPPPPPPPPEEDVPPPPPPPEDDAPPPPPRE